MAGALQELRDKRLPLELIGRNVRIHFIDSTIVNLSIHVDQAGMDFIYGHDVSDNRFAVPLTAIAYLEML